MNPRFKDVPTRLSTLCKAVIPALIACAGPAPRAFALAPQDSTHYSSKWSLLDDEEYFQNAKVIHDKVWYCHKNGCLRARNFRNEVVFDYKDESAYFGYYGWLGSNGDYDVSKEGRIYYFSNTPGAGHRVVIVGPDGTRLGELQSTGRDADFFHPGKKFIELSPATGRVYLADRSDTGTKKGLVSVFDRDGNFLHEFPTTGILASTLEGPVTHLLVRSDAQGKDEVFVVDTYAGTQGPYYRRANLKVFGGDGSFLRLPTGGIFSQEFYAGHPLDTAYFWKDRLVFTGGTTWGRCTIHVAPVGVTKGDQVTIIESPVGGGQQIGVHDSGAWIRFTGPGSADRQTQGVYLYSYPSFSNFEASSRNAVPNPWVLDVTQRPGAGIVDIDYRVDDVNDSTVTTALLGFANGVASLGNVLPLKTLVENTGTRVGANQPTGLVQRVTWDAGGDWNVDFGTLRVMALARDSRSHWFDIHLVEIPADGSRPAVAISRIPLREEDFMAQFFWLVATKDPSVRLIDGVLFGTTGSSNGVILANGTASTAEGRTFLLARDGLRIATTDEITRAREGATPGYTVQLDPPLRMIRNTPSGAFPDQVNEFGIESQRLDWVGAAWYVVRISAAQ